LAQKSVTVFRNGDTKKTPCGPYVSGDSSIEQGEALGLHPSSDS